MFSSEREGGISHNTGLQRKKEIKIFDSITGGQTEDGQNASHRTHKSQ